MASTWYVDAASGSDGNAGDVEASPFRSIQRAIDVAAEGDRIVVGDGTYAPISSGNKRLMICSRNGASGATIDGGGTNRCATLGAAVSDTNTVVRGFTLQNGRVAADIGGGGVFGGSLVNCVIRNSKVGYGNGGGACGGLLYQCIVVGNRLWHVTNENKNPRGAGVAEARCIGCVIVSNDASENYRFGVGGAYKCELDNCIVAGNLSYNNGKTIELCNIVSSCIPIGDVVGCGNQTYKVITQDAVFVDLEGQNYRLLDNSSCLDVGENIYALGAMDYYGGRRIVNGVVDVGVYESQTAFHPIAITSIVARQRYPWNGKVDISFSISGEENVQCVTTLSAKDLTGNTNLPMRTVYKLDGSAVNVSGELVSPGTYHWVWDAAADLPDGFQCERVTVEVTAE